MDRSLTSKVRAVEVLQKDLEIVFLHHTELSKLRQFSPRVQYTLQSLLHGIFPIVLLKMVLILHHNLHRHVVNTFFQNHRIGSLDISGWEVPHEFFSPTSCSEQGHSRAQSRLLRAFSSWVFNTCKDGDCTFSLGSLFHCLSVFMGKKFSLICSLNLSFQVMATVPCSLTMLCGEEPNSC